MLNACTIAGRLGKDPELRKTQSGKSVVTFSLACDRDYKSAEGQKETDWIPVVAFGATADFIGKYAAKGRMVIVSGRFQIRKWTDNSGAERQVSEIVANTAYFGDTPKRDDGQGGGYPPQGAGYQPNNSYQAGNYSNGGGYPGGSNQGGYGGRQ